MKHILAATGAMAIMTLSSHAYATTYALTCTNSGSDQLNNALGGTSAWTSPSTTAAVVPGDSVKLMGFCRGNVSLGTSGITFGNDGNTGSLNPNDGINGQIELKGASVKFVGIVLEGGQNGATMSVGTGEKANVFVHDGGAANFVSSQIGPGTLIGVLAVRASAVTLASSSVFENGSANTTLFNDGLRAEGGSSLRLGDSLVTSPVSVISNKGNGITLVAGSSALMYGATIRDNGDCSAGQCGVQLYAAGDSIVFVDGSTIETASTAAQQPPLVEALAASTIWIENGSLLTNEPGGLASGAILVAAASATVLNSSTIHTSGSAQSVIEASASSTIVLAGGNNVSATGGSGSCTGACVIQSDHSSSIMQLPGTNFGLAAAVDTVTGNGAVQEQSSLDLGQGPVGGAYGLVWTGNLQVQQNSAFRLSGGTHITGIVKLQQGANGFFNFNNSGGSGSGAGAGNAVDGTVQCPATQGVHRDVINNNAPNYNVDAHVSNPASVTPNVMVGSLADFLGITDTQATPPACLNF